ncbi:MAG: glycosyltransferase family 2 protein, partial [Thermoanaerobaculia bacterium]
VLVRRLVQRLRARGHDVRHLHRASRSGYKAGALAAGLAQARGERIAVFDADFVPRPDFLRRSIPYFADPKLGMVQGSWEHINRGYSLLTRIEAILLDGHFLVEHTARHRSGCFFNFNGTAGVWRRAAIEDAGGWQHDTLTEDLDLSYRAQLQGWQFIYVPELGVPSELPVDINGFKSQQYRWTKGSIQTGRKLLARIVRSELPLRVKFEAFVHLTNNSSYLLMVVLSLLLFPAMLLRRATGLEVMVFIDAPLFLAASVSVVTFYLSSQVIARGPGAWRGEARFLPALMGLGIGLSINNARAVLSGLLRSGGTFHRTPKYRIERRGEDWAGKRYRAGTDPLIAAEGALGCYFLACAAYALAHQMWISLPFLLLFAQGYLYIFVLSVLPRLRARRADS